MRNLAIWLLRLALLVVAISATIAVAGHHVSAGTAQLDAAVDAVLPPVPDGSGVVRDAGLPLAHDGR
jgi:hypothetical protein